MFEESSPTDLSPPPPAYELTQQEFDQKTSHIVETSLSQPISQPQYADGWEEWDEAAFQANEARLREERARGASGSSTPQSQPLQSGSGSGGTSAQTNPSAHAQPGAPHDVRPLNIRKRSSQTPEKEKPSWYAQAGLGDNGSSSSRDPQDAQGSGSSRPRPASSVPSTRSLPEDPEDDPTAPPPPFAPTDTSLDGPSYELVQSQRAPSPVVVLRYNPGGVGSSPPPSPPASPVSRHTMSPSPAPSHLSMPPPRRPAHYAPSRPTTSYTPSLKAAHIPPPPRMDFNPLVAYTKPAFGHLPVDPAPVPSTINAASLYNSAVAAHLPTQPRRQPTRPQTAPYGAQPQGYMHSSQPQQPVNQYQTQYPNQYQTQYQNQYQNGMGSRNTYYPTPPPMQHYPTQPPYPNQGR
ncbi:hypothetical protein BD410DRAFT_833790 [Rickenella mellea]|uniref:Uncharacterized protein n=1 Tax=Rickenella mellea TaxID=50990 RepID=A0A4R5XEN2_9AGAM|nr:hypothetical protein BD410DRAFT_833790 [Rickenella mellea]